MHPQLRLIAAQERIADMQRAADDDRLVHAATTHAVPAPATPPPRQSPSCAGSAAVLGSRVPS